MNTDLNYRVATEVMGYTINPVPFRMWRVLPDGYNDTLFECPDYSGTWAGAELVVEELTKKNIQVVCRLLLFSPHTLVFSCQYPLPHANCFAALDICEKLKAQKEG